jgi:hypothetical protein
MGLQPIGGMENNPYTLEHWKLLRNTQRKLHDLSPILDKAEKCGIGCSDLRAIHDGLATSLELIQANFFNPPPTGELGS